MPPYTPLFQTENQGLLTLGKYISLGLAITTLVTFGFAMTAIPISGSNAPGNNGFSFPYLNTLGQFPKDFIWQYLALIQLVVFLGFIGIIKYNFQKEKAFFSNLSSSFAVITVTVLGIAYYTQVMVIPSSLAKGQTDGLGLLIQYNPQGLFIALEELGYLMMGLSLWSLIPLAGKSNQAYKPIKIVLLISLTLTILSVVAIHIIFGLDKQDRFEVAVISIDWLTLMILGVMFFRVFRREERALGQVVS